MFLHLYQSYAQDAARSGLSFERFLLALCEAEMADREARRIEAAIRRAKFPFLKELTDYDFTAVENISKTTFLELAQGGYMSHAENLILVGNPGLGKTHLAIGLALSACRQGKRVRFYKIAALINDLQVAQKKLTLSGFVARFVKLDLLVLDELGFIAVDKAGGQLLFQLVSDLYEQVSMIITSNLRFGDWNSIFAESTIPQLNTLFNNPDEENGTEIEVSDPTHPLFGHRFALISVSSPLHGPGSAFVSYREYMVLRLPVASTTLALSRPVISTKLTPDAIKELLTIAEDCEALNALSPKPNLEAPAPRTATLYQRRTLDHPAGGTL